LTGKTEGLPGPPEQHKPKHPIYHRNRNSHLPFLDIDIYRRTEGNLGHAVYKKPTYTNFYLNARLHHNLVNKEAVLSKLAYRT
jgi:hypothetical protein